MVIGDPYKFGFLIDRVGDWEYPPYINGLMIFYLNKKAYPKDLRTTTLSIELPELLDDKSPLLMPKRNKRLCKLDGTARFEKIAALTFPEDIDKNNDFSYLVPFHEINDSGITVFTVTDEEQVIIMVGEWSEGKLLQTDERVVDILEYESVIAQLKEYCDSLNIPPFEEEKPEEKAKDNPKAKAKAASKKKAAAAPKAEGKKAVKKPADKAKSGKAAVRRVKK